MTPLVPGRLLVQANRRLMRIGPALAGTEPAAPVRPRLSIDQTFPVAVERPPRSLRSPAAVAGWLMLLWMGLAGFFAVQMVTVDRVRWDVAASFAVLDWGPWIVLSPLVLWLAKRIRIDGQNWRRTVSVHVVLGVGLAAGLEMGAQALFDAGVLPAPVVVGPAIADRAAAEAAARPVPRLEADQPRARRWRGRYIRARLALPIYFVLVAAAHAVGYHRTSLERERRVREAETQLTKARLTVLQNQLQPHFLFNTLNTISALIHSEPHAADEMLCALSDLLRGVLAVSGRQELGLEEELKFSERYLAIQHRRFNDRLEVALEIEPGIETAQVPTLILQPLVENAVIHGIAGQTAKGRIVLRACSRAGRLLITVADTGGGAAAGARQPDGTLAFAEGIGLTNTRTRLAAFYDGDFRLEFAALELGGVEARLNVPLRRSLSS